jgi:antitoxin component of RelBE/YafQ-DinJ toxin-antitoxin module
MNIKPMALPQKTSILQIRLDPDLLEKAHEVAEFYRMPLSALIRSFFYSEISRMETRKRREKEKKEKEEIQAAESIPEAIPSPDSFELEKTPPAPAKRAVEPKNREVRRKESAAKRKEEKYERLSELAEQRKKANLR